MLFNLGGSSSGQTLIVTAPVGVEVKVFKDNKMRTGTVDDTGTAVFRCLTDGEWTINITDGTKTSTRKVTIAEKHKITMAFFTATINVTYPAGSTCTCSDGITTLTAADTTGNFSFMVPNEGEWTISCTNGTESTSDKVTITGDNQTRSVTLEYYLRLYSPGNQHESTTGGWVGFSNYSFTSNGIELGSASSDSRWAIGTKNSIDLTNYKTLVVVMNVSTMTEYVKFGLAYSEVVYEDPSNTYTETVTTITGKPAGVQTFELDVSKITTGNWLTINGKNVKGTITDIYCMK